MERFCVWPSPEALHKHYYNLPDEHQLKLFWYGVIRQAEEVQMVIGKSLRKLV